MRKKSIFKENCNDLAGFFSSIEIVVTKAKFPSPAISYTYPQLVTLCIENSKHAQLKNLVVATFKKISYTSSVISYTSPTISYTYPKLVTLHPQLVTLFPVISYTSSVISCTCCSIGATLKAKTVPILKLLKFFIKLVLKFKGRQYAR